MSGAGDARGEPPPFHAVDALFARARRAPAAERAALLADASPAVRAEVEALLAVHEADAQAFLDAPALGADFRLARAGATPRPERVGRYRVLELLGEGGMGSVYRAEQEHPRREVALKLLRAGVITPTLRRRFEREADVLGRLRHPGIAQVLEAGVADDDRPFIAMELVRGEPLLEHVRRAGLDRRGRLELFARPCDAVAHAHAQGVVHRDLKPANVLVEPPAQPKVLDFGVARVTDADLRRTTLATHDGELLGTLAYMSPEQAAGDLGAVDARSDVYALGVMLFELLTDRLPHELAGLPVHAAVRRLREEPAARLASVDRALAGDLDTLVGMALAPEAGRRYPSAAALADDVRRFLAHEPILAHPPSTLYQLRKTARRHRALLTLAGGVSAALLVGLLAVLLQWQQTRAARDLARQRFDDLQALAGVFIRDVDGELLHLSGALPARRRIVETALDFLDPLAGQAGDDPELLRTLVAAYGRVGDIQGLPGRPNLGSMDGARTSWERALQLLDALEARAGASASTHADRHDLLARLGDLERASGRPAEALALYERAQDAWRAARAARGDDAWAPLPLRARVADVLVALGRAEAGAAELAVVAEEARRHAAARPDDWKARRDVAVALMKLAIRHEAAGEHERALPLYAEYVERIEPLLAEQPHHVVLQRDLATGHDRWRDALLALGRDAEARVHHAAASRGYEAILAAAPDDAQALSDVCLTLNRSGELALADGRPEEARPHFERFLEISARLVELDPGRASYLRRRGVALFKLGELHAALGADAARPAAERAAQLAGAREWFERCLEHFVDMRERGLLQPGDAGVPDEVAGQVAACEAALAML